MTDDELLQLPVADFMIVRTLSKKTDSEHFTISFDVSDALTFTSYIDKADFYVLVRKYSAQPGYNKYRFKCHYRLSRGYRAGGPHSSDVFDPANVYYYIEFLVTKSHVIHPFFAANQIELLKLYGLGDLKVFERRGADDDLYDNSKIDVID